MIDLDRNKGRAMCGSPVQVCGDLHQHTLLFIYLLTPTKSYLKGAPKVADLRNFFISLSLFCSIRVCKTKASLKDKGPPQLADLRNFLLAIIRLSFCFVQQGFAKHRNRISGSEEIAVNWQNYGQFF